ncbi:transposase, partial [Desulfovibrio sp.]|uniref:transposase n=1 Tax=Desulfovibrio sp. TaxID=885 RepID=UPI00344FFC23
MASSESPASQTASSNRNLSIFVSVTPSPSSVFFARRPRMAIIAESFTTTTSVSAGARRHGIDKNQLFQWRRQ